MTTAGLVLCGGRSQRMGRPKAWLPFGGETLLQRIVRRLGEAVAPVLVVAAPDQDLPPLPPGVAIVRDAVEGRGPLQGLAAGLEALAGRAEAVFVSSTDVPFLEPAWVHRLVALLGDHQIAVPRVGEHFHPLSAVYRAGVLPTVRELLGADRLRPFFLFSAVPTRVVGPEELADVDPTFATLRNLNTPEDYQAALRDAGLAG